MNNKIVNLISAKYPNHNLFNKDGSVNYDHPYYHQFDNVDFSEQKITKAKLIKEYVYGEKLTFCCNSYATYIEDERCCKSCHNVVSSEEG